MGGNIDKFVDVTITVLIQKISFFKMDLTQIKNFMEIE